MTITSEAAQVYRDRQDGIRWNPKKDEIRALFAQVDLASRFALYEDSDVRTTAQRAAGERLSVLEFSSLVTDGCWAAAFEAACEKSFCVHAPAQEGGYPLKRGWSMTEGGNFLSGDGHAVSYFAVDADTFDMNDRFVVHCPASGSEKDAGIEGFGFRFVQPDSDDRADFNPYPWAVDFPNVSRSYFDQIRIEGAGRGFNLQGNTGGVYIGRVEVGAYIDGLAIGGLPIARFVGTSPQTSFAMGSSLTVDPPCTMLPFDPTISMVTIEVSGTRTEQILGEDYTWSGDTLVFDVAPATGAIIRVDHYPNLDFTFIEAYLSWCFGFQSTNRLVAYRDGGTSGGKFGRCDGLGVKNFATFCGKVTATGVPFRDNINAIEGPIGGFLQLKLDSEYANFRQELGRLAFATWYSSSNTDDDFAVQHNGGTLTCGPATVFGPPTGTENLITSSGGFLILGATNFPNGPTNKNFVRAEGDSRLIMASGAQILVGTNTARGAPFIEQADTSAVVIQGITLPAVGTGTGAGIVVASNDTHIVSLNDLNGWTLTRPATGGAERRGIYGPNSGEAAIRSWGGTASQAVVSGVDAYILGAGTAIDAVTGGYDGMSYSLTATADRTLNNGGSFKLRDAVNRVIKSGEVMRFTIRQNIHVEENVPLVAWTSTSITPTPAVGSFGSASATIRYRVSEGIVEGSITNAITTISTATGPVSYTMPFTAAGSEAFSAHDFATGNVGGSRIAGGSATLSVCATGNAMLGGSGSTVVTSFNYRVQPPP